MPGTPCPMLPRLPVLLVWTIKQPRALSDSVAISTYMYTYKIVLKSDHEVVLEITTNTQTLPLCNIRTGSLFTVVLYRDCE